MILARNSLTASWGATAKRVERVSAEAFVGERRWLRIARPKYAPVVRYLSFSLPERACVVAAFIIPPRSTHDAQMVDLIVDSAVRCVRAAVRLKETVS